MGYKEVIKRELVNKIVEMGNGLIVNYNTVPVAYQVELISADMICEVIDQLDTSGNFEGYLEGNGVDQDWCHSFVINNMEIEMWGSMTSGNCCVQSSVKK